MSEDELNATDKARWNEPLPRKTYKDSQWEFPVKTAFVNADVPSSRSVLHASHHTEIKGHGWIIVSESVWSDIGSPETTQEWHDALLLSDHYEVQGVFRKVLELRPQVHILVRSNAIPVSDKLPDVTPIYRKCEEGKNVLDRIQMSTWDGERWRTIDLVGESIHEH